MPYAPLALSYHGVDDVPLRQDVHRAYVSPRQLRRQILRLMEWDYELLTFSAWAERTVAGRGRGCAALTFDDGFADNLHALVPLLRELGVPATVFVVSGWLGKRHPRTARARVLTGGEVAELHAAGVEIGAHTRTHANLPSLSAPAATAELTAGRADLEDLLGVPVTTLAYPYGAANGETVELARRVGFSHACRALGLGGGHDPLDLRRQDMGNHSSMLGLRLKRDDRYMRLMHFRPARLVRRARLTALGAPLRRSRTLEEPD